MNCIADNAKPETAFIFIEQFLRKQCQKLETECELFPWTHKPYDPPFDSNAPIADDEPIIPNDPNRIIKEAKNRRLANLRNKKQASMIAKKMKSLAISMGQISMISKTVRESRSGC